MAKRSAKQRQSARKTKPAKRAVSKARGTRKARKVMKAQKAMKAPKVPKAGKAIQAMPAPKASKAVQPPARRAADRPVQTPPSSLDMVRRGTAVRTGRAELAQRHQNEATMTPSITGGDVDADVENAYFSGDEAPGGDNPTPDQDIVDDIGKALGVTYQDAEELKASDKVIERDKHRWELDPASAEDYKERK